MNSIFQLEIERKLPKWIHAGQPLTIDWQVKNERRLLPCWGIMIADSIRRSDVPEKKATKVEAVVAQINPGATAYAPVRTLFNQRGQYQLGPARVSSKFPLGLTRAWYEDLQHTELIVAPRLGHLTESWTRKLQSATAGLQASSRQRGFSQDEFYALRPFRSGDSQKLIHWRTSAKHNQPIVKQFDQQTDQDYAIVLDLWRPNSDAPEVVELVELATCFTSTVVSSVQKSVKGNIAIGIFGEQQHVFFERVSPDFTSAVMRKLALVQPARNNQLAAGLESIQNSIGRSIPIIVISTRSRDQAAIEISNQSTNGAVDTNRLASQLQSTIWIESNSSEFNRMFQLDRPKFDFDDRGLANSNKTSKQKTVAAV